MDNNLNQLDHSIQDLSTVVAALAEQNKIALDAISDIQAKLNNILDQTKAIQQTQPTLGASAQGIATA